MEGIGCVSGTICHHMPDPSLKRQMQTISDKNPQTLNPKRGKTYVDRLAVLPVKTGKVEARARAENNWLRVQDVGLGV